MTIAFQCPGCATTLKVADELAGRKGKCAKCGNPIVVPGGAGPAKAAAPKAAAPAKTAPARAADTRPAVAAGVRPKAPVARPARRDEEEAPAEEITDKRPARARRRPPPDADEVIDGPLEVLDEDAPPRRRRKEKQKPSLLLPLLLGGGGVLVLAAAAVGVWWFFFSSSTAPTGPKDGPRAGGPPPNEPPPVRVDDDLPYLPDACTFLGLIRVAQLENSDAFKQLRAIPGANAGGFDTLAASLGVGETDLDGIVLGGKGDKDVDLLTVVHGKRAFKAENIQAANKRTDPNATATSSDVGKYKMYETKGSFGPSATFCVIDDHRVVLGNKPDVLRAALTRDKATDLSPPMRAVVKVTDFNAVAAYAATNVKSVNSAVGAQGALVPGWPALAKSLEKVDGVSASMKVATDVELDLTAVCPDGKAAEELRTNAKAMADAIKTALPLFAKDAPPGVADALDIDPQVTGSNVEIRKTIKTAPLIQWAKEQQPKATRPGAPGGPVRPGAPGGPGVPPPPGPPQ